MNRRTSIVYALGIAGALGLGAIAVAAPVQAQADTTRTSTSSATTTRSDTTSRMTTHHRARRHHIRVSKESGTTTGTSTGTVTNPTTNTTTDTTSTSRDTSSMNNTTVNQSTGAVTGQHTDTTQLGTGAPAPQQTHTLQDSTAMRDTTSMNRSTTTDTTMNRGTTDTTMKRDTTAMHRDTLTSSQSVSTSDTTKASVSTTTTTTASSGTVSDTLNTSSGYGMHTGFLGSNGLWLGVGGGASIPVSNFKDNYKTGWNATVGLGWQPWTFPVGLRLDGSFNKVTGRTVGSGTGSVDLPDAKIWSGMLDATLNLPWGVNHNSAFYIMGGGGVHHFTDVGSVVLTAGPTPGSGTFTTTTSSMTKFGVNGGAGLAFGWGSAQLFVEGRYVSVFTPGKNTNYIPVIAGFRFF